MNCRICNEKADGPMHTAREMMFGFKDEFQYVECPSCGCLQIIEYPAGIEKYYPANYYSLAGVASGIRSTWWKKYKLALKLMLPQRMKQTSMGNWMVNSKANAHSRILDIGCGKGQLVCDLYNLGFTKVQGLDKYLEDEIDYGYGVKILNKELNDLPIDSYDLLMMHHAFEHMENPLGVLQECSKRLKKGGCLLIRIPVKAYAWEKYNTNWIQLDAPRHYYIHTVKSIKHLIGKTAFTLKKVEYDSLSFQFWGSEQYERGIPLMSPDSYFINRSGSIFSQDEIREFEARALELNMNENGDQAAFYLFKS